MVRPNINGYIFDLDGVITDTAEYHYLSWQRLANEEGIPFSRAENEALRGVPRRESLMRLLKGRVYPEAKLQEMTERKNRYYQEYVTRIGPRDLLPGAKELLEEICTSGFKTAIGSASKNAQTVISRLGIDDLIDAVSDGYSVVRQKPDPDLFVHAAGQVHLPVDECVVFEDAAAGVQAAKTGGFYSVGLGPPSRVGAANVVFASLDGVRLDNILEKLQAAQPAARVTR